MRVRSQHKSKHRLRDIERAIAKVHRRVDKRVTRHTGFVANDTDRKISFRDLWKYS